MSVVYRCNADIAFCVDNSGSIRDNNVGDIDNWQLIIDFLQGIVRQLNVSQTQTRIAAINFGNVFRFFLFID